MDAIALTGVGVSALGVLIRWTVRDSLPVAASLFYALPLIAVAGILLAAAVVWLMNRRKLASAVCVLAALIAAGLWIHGAYYHNGCEPSEDGIRILTWNTARGFGGWPQIAEHVGEADADIVGLVEAGGSTSEWQQFWAQALPQYQTYLAGGGLAVLTKGEIVEKHVLRLTGPSTCADVQIDIDGRRVRVVLVDAVVRPFSHRRELIERVFELALAKPGLPTIIMGDFNTPIDSVWFDAVREDFIHAFEAAGNGMLTTWPQPWPTLAIDHVWVSPRFRVDCASIGWSWASDHRPLLTDVAVPGQPNRF